jgi:sugar (pentulose or hexulose) kinase
VKLRENIVGLDIGISSVRALLFDNEINSYPDVGLQEEV